MRNNTFIIAREGWSYLLYSVVAFVIFSILNLDFFTFFAFLAIIFFVYIFRNPEREVSFLQSNAVVSPVDGVVMAIEDLEDSEYRYKIDIDSSYLDVSILRIPMNSKVTSYKVVKGSRVSKASKLFSVLNEYAEIHFLAQEDNHLKVEHRLKQGIAPISINLLQEQELVQSARYGYMANGITSLYVKANFRLNIAVGQEIKASKTLIGYFS